MEAKEGRGEGGEIYSVCVREPYKSQVYWLRKVECQSLAALIMQKEKLAIKHMQTYIKATRSVGPVEWTPYPTDLKNAHRDAREERLPFVRGKTISQSVKCNRVCCLA